MLIQDGKARAFCDQWAALACTLSLEDGVKRLLKDVPKLYEAADELMDWAFAEAGFLIDTDERVCIAFGSPDVDLDDMPEDYRDAVRATLDAFDAGWPAFVEHIKKGWPGYTMMWDGRGVDAFAEHLQRRGITTIKTAKPAHPKSVAKKKPDVVLVPAATPKRSHSSANRSSKKNTR